MLFCVRASGIACVCVVLLEGVGCMGCAVQDTSHLRFSAELPYRQSADFCMAKRSNLVSVRRHFTKSLWAPHEESADTL